MGKRGRVGVWIIIAVVAGVGLLGIGLRKTTGEAVGAVSRAETIGLTMGTVARVVVDAPEADGAVAQVMQELDRLSVLFDRFRPFGDVAALNASRGEWVTLSPEVLALLQEAVRLAEVSGGAFDPTVAPLIDLWGFVEEGTHAHDDEPGAGDDGAAHDTPDEVSNAAAPTTSNTSSSPTRLVGVEPPDPAALAAALELVDYRTIEIDAAHGRARLGILGQAVDLGAVAKGYGVDRAAELLRARGAVRGLVDLGGDIYALGTRVDGAPWRLGIRHPRKSGQLLGILHVSDAAVATSGDYERYFEYQGVRYSHIVDPKTGWPANELVSVTIVAPSGVWADALATAVFVLGKEKGLALIEALPGVDGILVDRDLGVTVSSGLHGRVDLMEGV